MCVCVCATRTALVACSTFVHFLLFFLGDLFIIYTFTFVYFQGSTNSAISRRLAQPHCGPVRVSKENKMDERQKTGCSSKMGREINLGHPPCTETSPLHSLFYAFIHSLYTPPPPPPTFTPSEKKTSHRQPQSAPYHHLPNLSPLSRLFLFFHPVLFVFQKSREQWPPSRSRTAAISKHTHTHTHLSIEQLRIMHNQQTKKKPKCSRSYLPCHSFNRGFC